MVLDEKILKRKIQIQKAHSWDIENDIPWDIGIDVNKQLLPPISSASVVPNCTPNEAIVFSQTLGLMTASAIAEHEKMLIEMKQSCFLNTINRYKVSDSFKELGELFFQDEAKHSNVFNRYIDLYASQLNVTPEELRSILPVHNNKSIISTILRMNSYLGGMSFWWTVATTEEHSMEIFRIIRPMQNNIDPLYYQIHKLHFEEEVRHSSFAKMMLSLYRSENANRKAKFFNKWDFALSDLIEKCWTVVQLQRLSKVSRFKDRHPFFETLTVIVEKIKSLPLQKRIEILLNNTDYLSLMVHSAKNKNIQTEINKSKAVTLNFLEGIK